MTKRAELRAVWSKRERDFMFHFDRQPADGHFLHSFMRAGQMDVTDASSGEAMAAFRAALERRGFDPDTFRISVRRKREASR